MHDYVFARHELYCIKALLISMNTRWSKAEAKEILKECEKLRESIDFLENKAKEVIQTSHKVIPFEKPDKKAH